MPISVANLAELVAAIKQQPKESFVVEQLDLEFELLSHYLSLLKRISLLVKNLVVKNLVVELPRHATPTASDREPLIDLGKLPAFARCEFSLKFSSVSRSAEYQHIFCEYCHLAWNARHEKSLSSKKKLTAKEIECLKQMVDCLTKK